MADATAGSGIAWDILRPLVGDDPVSSLKTLDLTAKRATGSLRSTSEADDRHIGMLRMAQRLARISGTTGEIDRLYAAGYRSAADIAAVPEEQFVGRYAAAADATDRAAARSATADEAAAGTDAAAAAASIHKRARQVHSLARHAAFGLRDIAGSRHFRATRGFSGAQDAGAEALLDDFPSYQDLFGGLNYTRCEDCESIFGPSAYFLDIMRIVDDRITTPNKATATPIPEGYSLPERRPDLFTLELTCSSALNPIAYLAVVNRVMAERLKTRLGADPYQALAAATYPANLPFNLPLTRLRLTVATLKSSLEEVYASLLRPDDVDGRRNLARETIGLTVEQLAVVATPHDTAATVAPLYGIADAATLVDTLGSYAEFKARTGLDRAGVMSLIYEDLSAAELEAGGNAAFFINATGEDVAPVALVWDTSDPDDPTERLTGLTVKRLDRITRFLRLAAVIGWDCPSLDWAMRSVGAAEITVAIEPLADIKTLAGRADLTILQACVLWHDMRTSGRGHGGWPQDFFDRVFNAQSLTGGRDPYAGDGVPFDPARPMDWDPRANTPQDAIIRGRLAGALKTGQNDLAVLAAYAACLLGRDPPVLKTDLPTLSLLYRLTVIPTQTGTAVRDYLNLLRLIYAGTDGAVPGCADRPSGNDAPTAADYLVQLEAIAWLSASGFSVDELLYVVTGAGNEQAGYGIAGADIVEMINGLAAGTVTILLAAGSFVFETIDQDRSAAIFAALVDHDIGSVRYLSPIGVLEAVAFPFTDLRTLLPLTADAFETEQIGPDAAAAAFAALLGHGVLVASPAPERAFLSADFTAETPLAFLFPGDPDAQTKIGQVRGVLLQNRSEVRHVIDVLAAGLKQQLGFATQGLATFLGLDVDTLTALIPAVVEEADLSSYLVELLTPIPAGEPPPPRVAAFIAMLARLGTMATTLDLQPPEITAIVADPAPYGYVPRTAPSLAAIRSLWAFKQLVAAFGGRSAALTDYFALPSATAEQRSRKRDALAQLSGWPAAQIDELTAHFWRPPTADFHPATVGELTRFLGVFELAARLGGDVRGLMRLDALAGLPLIVGGTFSQANWGTYNDAATVATNAVSAIYLGAFADVDDALKDDIETAKRDVLQGYLIHKLDSPTIRIADAADLYQYLLIDTEMSACDRTSLIAEGIGAVQLYMQRCRLNLEPGVTDLQVPDVWWDWMSNYRIWEANRRIFVYPENYVEPTLRRGASPQFDSLRDELKQNDITVDTVDAAFRGYMDGFSDMARLKVVSTYRVDIPVPGGGPQDFVETVFFFGRTNTEPYTFYYRKAENYRIMDISHGKARASARWTPWTKIDITIASAYISPIHAFGRLMIFWIEPESRTNSSISNQSQEDYTVQAITIKFSFLNFSGNWSQPQIYRRDVTHKFDPDDYIRSSPIGPSDLLGDRNIFWQRIYAAHLPPESYVGPRPPFDNAEQVLLLYGLNLVYRAGVPVPPLDPPPADRYPQRALVNDQVYRLFTRAAGMAQVGAGKIPDGQVVMKASTVMSASLDQQDQPLVILDTMPNAPPGSMAFSPYIDGTQLRLADFPNAISADYYADSTPGTRGTPPTFNGPTALLLQNFSPPNLNLATVKNQPGWFVVDNGDDMFLASALLTPLSKISDVIIGATEVAGAPAEQRYVYMRPFTVYPRPPLFNIPFAFSRLGTDTIGQLSRALSTGGVDALLRPATQRAKELNFKRFYPDPDNQPINVIDATTDQLDFNGAYGPYFWEVFFHTPFLVADRLGANQRFAEAKQWYEYIFNPTQKLEDDTAADPKQRYWRFLPFRDISAETLREILSNVDQIAAYNDTPFDPDAIARLRPTAYPKAIVMRYIRNLIDWADYQFSQDTRESIDEARNLYVLASDLLGPKPEDVGDFDPPPPKSYDDIKAAYATSGQARGGSADTIVFAMSASARDDFYNGLTVQITGGAGVGQVGTARIYDGESRTATMTRPWLAVAPDTTSTYSVTGIPQFLIDAENSSLIHAETVDLMTGNEMPFNDLGTYFCVPENGDLMALWDLIADRLFKIRHCMNIAGQERPLALYAPPINPRDLIRAMAAGVTGPMLSAALAAPVPRFRFTALLDRAKGICATTAQLGGQLLSILQAQDAEALALMQAQQQAVILAMQVDQREKAISQAELQGVGLNEALAAATLRQTHFSQLLEGDGLIQLERDNLNALTAGLVFQMLSTVSRTASAIAYTIPQIGSPFAITYGGVQVGSSLASAAAVFEIGGAISNFIAQRSAIKAGYQRRSEDWTLQRDLATRDVAQLTAQIDANTLAVDIARAELAVQRKTIEQNAQLDSFLRRKFTNKELYDWMAGRLSTTYFQTYQLAFDMARSVQRAFQYENNSSQSFVNFGYWDSRKKGLLAGEGLMLALQQMEAQYVAQTALPLQIVRRVSLLETDPMALISLRETGACAFELSERLFAQDYPTHYRRVLKTISVSMPAVVGPYQNIKATLTQFKNQIVVQPKLNTVKYLLGLETTNAPTAEELRTNWVVSQQIALSNGINDNGMFQLNFDDPRYLPFEGTGAVSSWRLTMPKAANRFDYSTITDVIVEVKYSALDAGATLADVVKLAPVKTYSGARLVDAARAYPIDWEAFMTQAPQDGRQTLAFTFTGALAPPQVDGAKLGLVALALDVADGKSAASATPYIALAIADGAPLPVTVGPQNIGSVEADTRTFTGAWMLTFDLAKTPQALKGAGGRLDPAALRTIGIVLDYSGTLAWS